MPIQVFIYITGAEDLKRVLQSVGAQIEEDKLNNVVNSLKGKNLHEVLFDI